MKKLITRFSHPLRGLVYATSTDRSFRSQIYGVGSIVALAMTVFEPLAAWELLFLIQAYLMILITELQNSAFEKALDRLHPEQHDHIGRSKDMAAAAVLTAGSFLGIVLLVITVLRVV